MLARNLFQSRRAATWRRPQALLAGVLCAAVLAPAAAQGRGPEFYPSYPPAPQYRSGEPPAPIQVLRVRDVAVQYVRGELRFCELHDVKGILCQARGDSLARATGWASARDWWSARTYVAAVTGRTDARIERVEWGPGRNQVRIEFR